MKNQIGTRNNLLQRIQPVQTNRRSEACSQSENTGLASQKRLTKISLQCQQHSRYNTQAQSLQQIENWNTSMATEQVGQNSCNRQYEKGQVINRIINQTRNSQELTLLNESSLMQELLMQESIVDTYKQAHEPGITYDLNEAEVAIESELINEISLDPESQSHLEKSIERSLTQTRMHQILQFSDEELEDIEQEQLQNEMENQEYKNELQNQLPQEGSSSTEYFEDVTPYQQSQEEEYESYVLDFTQEKADELR